MNTTRTTLPLWKNLLFAGILIITGCAGIELVARIVVPPMDILIRQENVQFINAIGLPDLNDLMEFDPILFWVLKKQIHDARIQGTIGSSALDFTVNIRNRLRFPQRPGTQASLRILAIGDSCTFGVGVNDGDTWPAQLQALFDHAKTDVSVINAGVPGYTAFQGKQWLEKQGLSKNPNIVIATFGFNDFETWASQSDFETARYVRLKRWDILFSRSRLYYGMQLAVQKLIPQNARNQEKPGEPRRARLSAEEFSQTLLQIKKICDEHQFGLILVIWPYKGQLAGQYGGYQPLIARVAEQQDVPLLNLVEVFGQITQELFVDSVHANQAGNRVVANALFQAIVPALHPQESRPDD
jgi:lysophospholipase L1-like esterase